MILRHYVSDDALAKDLPRACSVLTDARQLASVLPWTRQVPSGHLQHVVGASGREAQAPTDVGDSKRVGFEEHLGCGPQAPELRQYLLDLFPARLIQHHARDQDHPLVRPQVLL